MVQLAAYPAPRFMWSCNGTQIVPSQKFKVLYEQGIVTLMIYNVQQEDSGDYMLHASNEHGQCTWKTTLNIAGKEKHIQIPSQPQQVNIISKSVSQDVTDSTIQRDVAPVFLESLPPETAVNEGAIARLEAHIQAHQRPQIQWLRNGIVIKPSVKYTISWEEDKSVLLIKRITGEDTGVYTCRAISDIGEAVCSTTLFVIPKEARLGAEPPRFMLALQSCEAFDGEEVVLTCTVTGRPKPAISWFHNNKNIDKSEDFVLNYNAETGKCDCVIVECLPDDQGTFKCIAKNEAGETSTECKLIWKAAPVKLLPREEPIKAEVSAVVKAKPAPIIEKKINVVKKQEFNVEGECRLDVETLMKTEHKKVKKVVKKVDGDPPRFTTPIQPQVVKEGETIIFNAVFTGTPVPEIAWIKDKVELTMTDRYIMGFCADSYTCSFTIHNATENDVGVYSCRGSNPAGRATCTANVVVVPLEAEIMLTEKTKSVKREKVTIVDGEETHVSEISPEFVDPLNPHIEAMEGSSVK